MYLLDALRNEIHVLDHDGTFLRSLGRSGSGPGEFHSPMAMVLDARSQLAVIQTMPSRIPRLTTSGEPRNDLHRPDDPNAAFTSITEIQSAGGGLILAQIAGRLETGRIETVHSLMSTDTEGTHRATLFEHTMSEVPGEIVAGAGDDPEGLQRRWATTADGVVYVAHDPSQYLIDVFDLDGLRLRRITRDYARRRFTSEEREKLERDFGRMRAQDRANIEIKIPRHDADIQRLLVRPSGEVWVLTSRGRPEDDTGSLGSFDVLDPQGRFLKEVEVRVAYDPTRDIYRISGEFLFVLREGQGAQRALSARFGGAMLVSGTQDAPVGDGDPLTIVGYRLASVLD